MQLQPGKRFMSDGQMPNSADSPSATAQLPRPKPAAREKHKPLPPFHVVLLDDDDHTYEYVVAMMRDVFAYNRDRGWAIARTVDKRGRAIVFTAHKELAELKRDQIHAYGADEHLLTSIGPMSAIITPAEVE
jgi:ATP-dependent Clp protease adaptor protein ClpS